VPTYDYQCRSCGAVTEVIHSMLEDGPSVCEVCGGQLRRMIFPTGIIFKGSGFYRNDSRSDSSTTSSEPSSKPASAPAPAAPEAPKGSSGSDSGAS
jgi:putative FmdB family regulatory protein